MRIAIVNAVKTTGEILKRIILSNRSYQLAWIAYNGKEAVEKCAEDTPDLILMDLAMPIMDGVQATEQIMKKTPCAILLVTSSLRTNVTLVFKAMGYGALDVMRTPILDLKSSIFGGDELLIKIDIIASLIGKNTKKVKTSPLADRSNYRVEVPKLLIIGSSTGGTHGFN